MLCRVCNTRVRKGLSSCPNCGSHSLTSAAPKELEAIDKLPDLESGETGPLAVDEEVELALDHATEVALEREVEDSHGDGDGDGDGHDHGHDHGDRAVAPASEADKPDPPVASPERRVQRSLPLGTPDPAGVRMILSDKPDLLEPGLTVFTSEKGTPLGAGYTSAVGEIDLLARDANGGLVVVMVAEPHEGAELISVVLQRIGWVRKHLSGGSARVRGVVLMDRVREDMAYAAEAVSDTISFKTYRVALAFDDFPF